MYNYTFYAIHTVQISVLGVTVNYLCANVYFPLKCNKNLLYTRSQLRDNDYLLASTYFVTHNLNE